MRQARSRSFVKWLPFLAAGLLAACAHHGPPKPDIGPATAPPPMAGAPGYAADAAVPARQIRVRRGQTLYAVSREEDVPVRSLLDANGLQPPFRLKAGQVLTVPAVRQHIVRPGETLFGVARNSGVEVTTLVRLNHLQPPYRIRTGTAILLPPPVAAENQTTGTSGIWAPPQQVAMAPPAQGTPAPAYSPPPSSELETAPPNGTPQPDAEAAGGDSGLAMAPPQGGGDGTAMVPAGPVSTDESAAAPAVAAASGAVASEALGAPPSASGSAAPAPGQRPAPAAPVRTNAAQPANAPTIVDIPEGPPSAVAASPQIAAAMAAHPGPMSPIFDWPVRGRLLSLFGSGRGGINNDGINIAAPAGTTVTAAESGTVAYVGTMNGFGNLLLIKHGDGWITAYAHSDVILVRKGQRVHRGQPVARVGDTGGVAEPQLHFELRYNARAVDPLDHLPPLAAG
jgi:murein DD-endopeptidase MepM/ murein hydrolase activator NlpD